MSVSVIGIHRLSLYFLLNHLISITKFASYIAKLTKNHISENLIYWLYEMVIPESSAGRNDKLCFFISMFNGGLM